MRLFDRCFLVLTFYDCGVASGDTQQRRGHSSTDSSNTLIKNPECGEVAMAELHSSSNLADTERSLQACSLAATDPFVVSIAGGITDDNKCLNFTFGGHKINAAGVVKKQWDINEYWKYDLTFEVDDTKGAGDVISVKGKFIDPRGMSIDMMQKKKKLR